MGILIIVFLTII